MINAHNANILCPPMRTTRSALWTKKSRRLDCRRRRAMIITSLTAQPHPLSNLVRQTIVLARDFARRISSYRRAGQKRRSLSPLLEWDARLLDDVGLTRADVLSEIAEPVTEDPSDRLRKLKIRRQNGILALAREAALRHANAPSTPAISSISASAPSCRQG
jgi:uncharacterized protein YjiS (DUF1127 family)